MYVRIIIFLKQIKVYRLFLINYEVNWPRKYYFMSSGFYNQMSTLDLTVLLLTKSNIFLRLFWNGYKLQMDGLLVTCKVLLF